MSKIAKDAVDDAKKFSKIFKRDLGKNQHYFSVDLKDVMHMYFSSHLNLENLIKQYFILQIKLKISML